MIKVSELIKSYVSVYAASKALKISATQLHRWVKAGAMVDEEGQVWIKTRGYVGRVEK